MRGRCLIGTYLREVTALVGIGSYGTANIAANTYGRRLPRWRTVNCKPLLGDMTDETKRYARAETVSESPSCGSGAEESLSTSEVEV